MALKSHRARRTSHQKAGERRYCCRSRSPSKTCYRTGSETNRRFAGIGTLDARFGAYPLRALVKTRHGTPVPVYGMGGYETIDAALKAYSGAIALHPWLEQFPLALSAVTPVRSGYRWAIRDTGGHHLPLTPRFDRGWHPIAMSGGHPLAVFGEWNGDYLQPLSVWAEGRFFPIIRTLV